MTPVPQGAGVFVLAGPRPLTDSRVNHRFAAVLAAASGIGPTIRLGPRVTDTLPTTAQRPPRTMSREARRIQLMESTIETLAARGFSRTTLTEVAKAAGLSHGLVLFHFETKEKLLSETLAYLADEYHQNWQDALARVGDDPAEQLNAMLEADFLPTICTPARLAAWCAFWGEAQSRPLYQQACAQKDDAYKDKLEEICARLSDAGGYGRNVVHVARLLRISTEGVWLDMMTLAEPYALDEALATVRTCAALCFPDHFDATGPKRPG